MSLRLTDQRIYKDGTDYEIRAIRQAATIAAMRAIVDLTDAQVVMVPGFGLYRYDVSSTKAADGLAVVVPDTGIGRLILVGPGGDGAGIVNVNTWGDVQAAVPVGNLTLGALGKDAPGDGGYSVWTWRDGDTTADDGKYVLESTVVGYRPGETNEGRWWRVISGAGLIQDSSEFGQLHPGVWDVVFLSAATDHGPYKWHAGDKSATSAICYASDVTGFEPGAASEGRWKPTPLYDNLLIPPVYAATGTLSFTSGSPTVTGTGTQFLSEVKAGDIIYGASVPSTWWTVRSVETDTSLTIAASSTSSASSVSYSVAPRAAVYAQQAVLAGTPLLRGFMLRGGALPIFGRHPERTMEDTARVITSFSILKTLSDMWRTSTGGAASLHMHRMTRLDSNYNELSIRDALMWGIFGSSADPPSLTRAWLSMAGTRKDNAVGYLITAVNTGSKQFTVAGDRTYVTGTISVVNSTGNDGSYTVTAAVYSSDLQSTIITVSETVPSAVADGHITETAPWSRPDVAIGPGGFVGLGVATPKAKTHTDGTTILGCHNAANPDADLQNGSVNIHVNEGSNLLTFKVKKSDGTVVSGTVTLS